MTPLTVTKFDRTEEELQYFWIYCIIVAGKNSDWASRTTGKLFRRKPQGMLPFEFLRNEGHGLHNTLIANRVGQYKRITEAIQQSYDIDLATCTIEDLEKIYGVGPKTARFFILHSRRDSECAVLDTHILRYLRDKKLSIKIPKVTPQNRSTYEQLSDLVISFIKMDFPNLSLAEADLLIWSNYSGRFNNDIKFAEDIFNKN